VGQKRLVVGVIFPENSRKYGKIAVITGGYYHFFTGLEYGYSDITN
jgi:hypothetical protein